MKNSFLFIMALVILAAFSLCSCIGDDYKKDEITAEDGDKSTEDGDDDTIDGDADLEMEEELEAELEEEMEAEEEAPWVLPYSSPEARGSYNAGASQVQFVNAEQERDLPGFIWYPTFETEGMGFNYDYIIPTEGAIMDPPIADEGPFPVVIFSHGSQAFAQQSFYLTEYLASHGFIVAAPNHIGNTTATDDSSRMGYIAQQRPRDLSIVIDHLEQWNEDENHILYHKMDLSKISAVGHSFGGFTVVYVAGGTVDLASSQAYCESLEDISQNAFCKLMKKEQLEQIDPELNVHDPRIKAVVPQAPAGFAFFTDAGMKQIKIPVQLQVGDLDLTVPHVDSLNMYDSLNPVKQLLLLKGAGHFTFSNMCILLPNMGDGCGEDGLDWGQATWLSNTYALSFIRYYVLGEERDAEYLTDEYANKFEEVVFSHEEKASE